ncbi:MAG: type IV pilin N-terminal domain-containing protein [Methanosarcinaceae archaeon]|nr:type IV pilin N-terminal domain-containing protein [Methanosarcinaceae archaeon]
MRRTHFKDDRATSPVIGVMLMLTVTVILAAAVGSHTSGMLTSTSPAPMATFEIHIARDVPIQVDGQNTTMSYLSIKEVTGDSIPTTDLRIITNNPQARGNVTIMEISPGVENTYYRSSYPSHLAENFGYRGGVSPYWNNREGELFGSGSFDSRVRNFGNYTLRSGVCMVADEYEEYTGGIWDPVEGKYAMAIGLPTTATGMQACFADWDSVSTGDFVNVRIIHIPSRTMLFRSDVEVM